MRELRATKSHFWNRSPFHRCAVVSAFNHTYQGERGRWAAYYTSPQRFRYNNVFITTLGTFIDFLLVGSLRWIINGDVHQIIDHCLIPLDACLRLHSKDIINKNGMELND